MDGENLCKSRAVGMEEWRWDEIRYCDEEFRFMWQGVVECGYEVDGRMSALCVGLFVCLLLMGLFCLLL